MIEKKSDEDCADAEPASAEAGGQGGRRAAEHCGDTRGHECLLGRWSSVTTPPSAPRFRGRSPACSSRLARVNAGGAAGEEQHADRPRTDE